MTRFALWPAAAVALALCLTPAASGHGGGGQAAGFHSTVSGLQPPVVGVLVSVLGGDDRLRVVNYSGKTIVVTGYDGEPFLRFTQSGVYENIRSPATYLSRERDPAKASVPASASATAAPQWRKIAASTESVSWHDHRIHWVRNDAPRVVRETPDEPHLIFHWRIPGTADDRRFAITGFLGYAPPPQHQASDESGLSRWLVAAIVAISVLAVATLAVGARRARRRAPT
jgi:hypothetical protein